MDDVAAADGDAGGEVRACQHLGEGDGGHGVGQRGAPGGGGDRDGDEAVHGEGVAGDQREEQVAVVLHVEHAGEEDAPRHGVAMARSSSGAKAAAAIRCSKTKWWAQSVRGTRVALGKPSSRVAALASGA